MDISPTVFANVRGVLAIGIAALFGGALFLFSRRASAIMKTDFKNGVLTITPEPGDELLRIEFNTLPSRIVPWAAPEKYRYAIQAAEGQHAVPPRLLERLLWQESRYREDVITGAVTSSAGALGIAQIVPRWHPDVDPLNPFAAIPYAANYLASLYRQFGTWPKALAAYNWGPGNLSRVAAAPSWLQRTPTETQNYVREITGDVPV